MKVIGTSLTVTELAEGMVNQDRSQALEFGGKRAIQGEHLMLDQQSISLIRESRNISERCPGDQTNNRAELIVSYSFQGQSYNIC